MQARWGVHACSRSCPTLCSPKDCSPPGSSAYGILQARILQCIAMSSSRNQTHVSCTGRWILKCRRLEGARAQWTEPHTRRVSPALSPNHRLTTRVLSALIFHSSWYEVRQAVTLMSHDEARWDTDEKKTILSIFPSFLWYLSHASPVRGTQEEEKEEQRPDCPHLDKHSLGVLETGSSNRELGREADKGL